jgi:predicted alpha-1,2-mannosidase
MARFPMTSSAFSGASEVDMTNPRRLVLKIACTLVAAVLAPGVNRGPTVQAAEPGAIGRHVNPFIGTGGLSYLCGNEFPGATVPFGMVRLSPDTVSGSGRRATNTSGYYYRDPQLLGFSHTRLAGTGAVDGGNFMVIPVSGRDSAEAVRHGLRAPFSHRDEVAFPGYYALLLPERGLRVELTATRRVGVHRYHFASGDKPQLLIHVSSALGRGKSKDAQVRILPGAREVEGSVRTFGTFSARYGGIPIHFVARSNRAFTGFGTWQDGASKPSQTAASGDDVGAELLFDSQRADGPDNAKSKSEPSTQYDPHTVELKLALSYVSVQNARENLDREALSLDFETVSDNAKRQWEEILGRIRVEGGTAQEQTLFYTALYHALQMPTAFSDVNGDYLGFDNKVHRASGFTFYTDMSLWDTFRTVHPLFSLIAPREQRDMAVSLVEMARQGGYLPRWPCGNGYSNSMFGTPADIMLTETYLKGIRDFDVETAYQAMRKAALGPTRNSRFSGRAGIEDYLKFGYCPSDLMKQSVARTLEYSYADHCISRLAESLGNTEDAALFAKHALSYRQLWNPETQYFQPRDSHGAFASEFRPLLLTYLDRGGKYTHAYVEGSALQWRWGVPYDGPALVSLFKSRAYFVAELEQFFSHSAPQVNVQPNGYYWHGNQPDLYSVYLFNAAGRPDLTRKWVHWILAHKYGDQENGLDGNDDGGTISAWYVLSSLGIFPTAGSDRYELVSPLWKRAELKLGNRQLVIAGNSDPANPGAAEQVRLNAATLGRTWIAHKELVDGATLRFEKGSSASVSAPGR